MTGNGSTTRQLQSWIGSFIEYTDPLPSPPEFRKWGAIACLAGAMERRCYIKTATGLLYPNMLALLVAPPAIGKSVIINEVDKFWRSADVLHVAPKSTTKEGFLDFLKEAGSSINFEAQSFEEYHCGLVPASEFGNFVPEHDTAWLNVINELYDCADDFTTRTRTKGEMKIKNTCLNIFGGSQPKFLAGLLPETAFGMGFTSRLIMVYATEKVQASVFSATTRNNKLKHRLEIELQEISTKGGEFDLSAEAIEYVEHLHSNGIPPIPAHPKLQNYNGRRLLHLLKLSMVFSISEDSSLHVTKEHVEEALRELLAVEADMPQIFKEMSAGTHGQALEECQQFLQHESMRMKGPVSEIALRRFLDRRVPVNQIDYILAQMVRGNYADLEKKGPKGKEVRLYRPVSVLTERG